MAWRTRGKAGPGSDYGSPRGRARGFRPGWRQQSQSRDWTALEAKTQTDLPTNGMLKWGKGRNKDDGRVPGLSGRCHWPQCEGLGMGREAARGRRQANGPLWRSRARPLVGFQAAATHPGLKPGERLGYLETRQAELTSPAGRAWEEEESTGQRTERRADRQHPDKQVVQETEKEPWRGRTRTGQRRHRSRERKGFYEAVHCRGCPQVQQDGRGSAGT